MPGKEEKDGKRYIQQPSTNRTEKDEPANFVPTPYIDIQLRLKSMNQSAYVVVERCETNINPIPEGQFFESFRQLVCTRNPGAVHQDWDHRDISLNRRFNL